MRLFVRVVNKGSREERTLFFLLFVLEPNSDYNFSIRRGQPPRIIGENKLNVFWTTRFHQN